ncbi:phosphoribosylformylglycinamidine cyclo-ligase [Paenibacillus humicola]|uniref:phosphoribosylformylglycinamidine cyclo-ligase n=1 Tax=Paenibacillus humicola TaxID=3110540 RepID=UPI00237A5770|nr:phosphoribosylformylglycinamidine cyclo-ligase [Paenibacillus humicola]
MESNYSYKAAGVDIGNADRAKSDLGKLLAGTDSRILSRPDSFASLFVPRFDGIEDPVLVLKAEEPGSKQLLAFQYHKTETICRDLIHHLINDIVVMGARPEAVLDIILCGKIQRETVVDIVRFLSAACREQGCSIVGGETSEQPGLLEEGRYMLNAAILGVVDRRSIIDGSAIRRGDRILALASNGPHTNGYSLIRKLMADMPEILQEYVDGTSFLEAILRPHTCYYRQLKDLLPTGTIHGMAHITGGGIEGNVKRILPEGTAARIHLSRIRIPRVFQIIRKFGGIPDAEMLKSFNVGAGLIVVAPPDRCPSILDHLNTLGCGSYEIGEITDGARQVEFTGVLNWQD